MKQALFSETGRWIIGMLMTLVPVIGIGYVGLYRLDQIETAIRANADEHKQLLDTAVKYTDTKSPYVFDRGSITQILDGLKNSQARLELQMATMSRDLDAVRTQVVRLDAKIESMKTN